MNPYDKAHELAKLLKESPEFQNFVRLQKLAEQNPQAKSLLQEFYKKQWEVQQDAVRGILSREKQEQLAHMYNYLQNQESLKEFFAAEMKFGRLITDIQGILAEAISEGCQLVGKLQHAD
ncbi:MAG TPA: YlbF family regulator [Negativicutes bacterium]|nr:YlbF family regulator [Negativicutes bacterium]